MDIFKHTKNFKLEMYNKVKKQHYTEKHINLYSTDGDKLLKINDIQQFYDYLQTKYGYDPSNIQIFTQDGTGKWSCLKNLREDDIKEWNDDYYVDKVKDMTNFQNSVSAQFRIFTN